MDKVGRNHKMVIRWGAGVAGLTLLGACGSSSHTATLPPASAPKTTTTTPAATTTVPTTPPPPSTTAATTTTTPPTPSTTTLVGLALDGVGTTFTAPDAPTTVAYTPSCQALIDSGFFGECVVVTSPSGTIAAIVEQQQQNYQAGQPITAGQERDLVYREVSGSWSLVLRRTPIAAGEATTQVYSSDIMRDGYAKAVFVEPAANSQYGNELDVVDGSGAVTLYRQLHGGFATVPTGGGLDAYVPDPVSGYDETTISYTASAWKIIAAAHVSDSQAQSLTSQAFFDPSETQATS